MNANHREGISISLTVAIVSFAVFIIHRFIPSFVWASIIVIATYPLYQQWRRLFGKLYNLSALLFTTILVLMLLVPLSWLISVLVSEFQLFIGYVQEINQIGGAAPSFFSQIPIWGDKLIGYWNENISQPGSVKNLLSNLHLAITPTSYYIKSVGGSLLHRGVQVGFTLLTLFFLYRDGDILFSQINNIGKFCLGERWFRYADKLPAALRATVNGTIAVGAGVGILMGVCYGLVGVPAPTLMGFFTAFAAMIPFVAPVVFGIVALILAIQGKMIAMMIVIIWGTVVMFIADHFIKPVLIGGAIQLPFLAVLFGILGGVETLGLLGLFVGPMVMVLFVTLWYESQGLEQDKQMKRPRAY